MRTILFSVLQVVFFLAMCSMPSLAQSTDTSALMTVTDLKELSAHEFQYAVYVTNTGKVALPLRGYSWGINMSSEMTQAQLKQSYIGRDEALNALPRPNVTVQNGQLKGTTTNASAGAEYLLQPGKKICVATVKVTNGVAWSSACYNPFKPIAGKNPASAGPLQVVSEGGKSQCLLSCLGYMIYANEKKYTANSVFGLTVDLQPSPDSAQAFKLNCK